MGGCGRVRRTRAGRLESCRSEPEINPRPHAVPLRGIVVSVVASLLFGVIALLGAYLDGFASEEVTGWRVVFIVLALGAVHIPRGQRREFVSDAKRIVTSPLRIAVLLVCTVIMWFQLWVFMWASANGHTQDVAMGYFLLPLVMVLVGRFLFHDVMSAWQRAAVIAAAVGVGAQLILTQSVGWPVLLIAGLYPVYFALRRWFAMDTKHVFLMEALLLLIPSAVFIGTGAFSTGQIPASTPTLLVVVGLSGVAMTLYILASTWLPLGLFGLLSYVEPVLLLGAAVILGYALSPTDIFVYGPILLALVFLIIQGARMKRGEQATISGQAVLTTTGTVPIVLPTKDDLDRRSR